MAPYAPGNDESGYKLHPGLIVLIVLITLSPIVVILIHRRQIWLSPFWNIAYKRGKRRYEADRRQITQNWVDIKQEMREHDSRPSHARHPATQPRTTMDGEVFPIVALPHLSYHGPGTIVPGTNYLAQPLQRQSRAATPLPGHRMNLSVPPPAYSAPYISPPPASVSRYQPHHGTLAPSKKAPRTNRVQRNEAIGNPFYPGCVNEQIESGSRFVSSTPPSAGRRLL